MDVYETDCPEALLIIYLFNATSANKTVGYWWASSGMFGVLLILTGVIPGIDVTETSRQGKKLSELSWFLNC